MLRGGYPASVWTFSISLGIGSCVTWFIKFVLGWDTMSIILDTTILALPVRMIMKLVASNLCRLTESKSYFLSIPALPKHYIMKPQRCAATATR